MTAVQLCRLSRFATATIIASLFIAWSAPRTAGADDNILSNPDLTEGSGNDPNGWVQAEHVTGVSAFSWLPAQDPPELDVSSPQSNDAFWAQALHLEPGWYHFAASIRSENVPQGPSGVALSLVDMGGIGSTELHGTTDWQNVGFYVKVGECGAYGRLGCRLGGFASMNTGLVACRDIVGETVDFPAPDGEPVFDLAQLFGDPYPNCPPPPGS
jgi:hypothetical protein